MTNNIEDIRKTFQNAEDVAPVDGLAPPDPSTGAEPPPRTPDDPPSDEDPHDPFMRAADQPLNDYGNGQRFVIHFGRDVMFVPRVGWFTWDGRVWQKDQDELAVRSKAQQIWRLIEQETRFIKPTKREEKHLGEEYELRNRLKELEDQPEQDRSETHTADVGSIIARLKALDGMLKDRKSLIGRRLTHAKNAGNNGPIGHMLTESTTDLAVDFEDLDRNPLDVNTESGLLRFSVTDHRADGGGKVAGVKLIPHERDQRLTKIMPVRYGETLAAPKFFDFLERVQPDREMREFLKRWLGLSMTGLKVQKLAFWYGDGANGKGVLIDTVSRILAGYAATIKIESLTGANRRSGAEATPDLIPMLGARSVRASEPEKGERFQEGLIKALTGGEPIPVRPNYGDQIDMDAIFKLTISGNHKPEVRGTDNGIWRRLMLVPWDVVIPDAEQDERLGEKLWDERDGIFAWLVEGAIDYLEGGLNPPDSVRVATDEYREESDPIGTFLISCCMITGEHTDSITSKELGDAFNYYLMERGDNTWKPTTVSRQISTKARQWRHPATGKQFKKGKASISQYTGLMFTDAFKARWLAAPKDAGGRAIAVAADTSPHPFDTDFRE